MMNKNFRKALFTFLSILMLLSAIQTTGISKFSIVASAATTKAEALSLCTKYTDGNGDFICDNCGEYQNENNGISANFYRKNIEISSDTTTGFRNTYSASTPSVVSFIDYKGIYNVASFAYPVIHINRYDNNLNLISALELNSSHQKFGDIICDNDGNYYICMGSDETSEESSVVLSLIKYDYNGNFISEISFTGPDLSPYYPADYWGTKIPFDAGSCSLAINNGVVACNFAREMYSGHQSNYVFYVDCNTMKRQSGAVPYCSHSFNQDCIATSDGGYLMANHGDAYDRGFIVSKITDTKKYDILTFSFREGSDRSYGYNETYAELGGLAETENAYILCASSERTLSLDVAPTKWAYCSYSEARDLFVQILKKDFHKFNGADAYYVEGETRKCTGEKPQSANTELFLPEGSVNYGVIWLTDYDDESFAAAPKIVTISENRLLIMWEKRSYNNYYLDETFYMILNEDGSIYKEATPIGAITLPANADIVYNNGSVYWTTYEAAAYINVLNISEHNYKCKITTNPTCTQNGIATFTCSDCSDAWTVAQTIVIKSLGHSFSNDFTTDKKATYTAEGSKSKHCTRDGCTEKTNVTVIPKLEATFKNSATAKLSGDVIVMIGEISVSQLLSQATKDTVIKDSKGNTLAADKLPCTGMTLVLPDGKKYTIVVYGDVDGDGGISAADARLALRASVGLENYKEDSAQYKAAKVGSIDKLSAADARLILRASVGLEDPKQWLK